MSDSAPSAIATPIGVPMSPAIPFYRMGEPLIIPVGPDTAATPFVAVIPPNATAFRVVNPNPFSVRLRGVKPGQAFVPVTLQTGWLWLPGTEGIYTSIAPALLSVMAVDGPFIASAPSQKAGTGVIELQYGTGC